MTNVTYFQRKENIVIKDFETAFKCYEHLSSKVTTIRQWTVTLMLGIMGFYMAGYIGLLDLIFLAGFCLVSFLILEIRERCSMKFDKDEILNLEEIFMLSNNEEYTKSIIDYEFRDLRLCKLSTPGKFKYYPVRKCIKRLNVLSWYILWVIFLIIIISITNLRTDKSNKLAQKLQTESIVKEQPPIKKDITVIKESSVIKASKDTKESPTLKESKVTKESQAKQPNQIKVKQS